MNGDTRMRAFQRTQFTGGICEAGDSTDNAKPSDILLVSPDRFMVTNGIPTTVYAYQCYNGTIENADGFKQINIVGTNLHWAMLNQPKPSRIKKAMGYFTAGAIVTGVIAVLAKIENKDQTFDLADLLTVGVVWLLWPLVGLYFLVMIVAKWIGSHQGMEP